MIISDWLQLASDLPVESNIRAYCCKLLNVMFLYDSDGKIDQKIMSEADIVFVNIAVR